MPLYRGHCSIYIIRRTTDKNPVGSVHSVILVLPIARHLNCSTFSVIIFMRTFKIHRSPSHAYCVQSWPTVRSIRAHVIKVSDSVKSTVARVQCIRLGSRRHVCSLELQSICANRFDRTAAGILALRSIIQPMSVAPVHTHLGGT